MTFNNHKRKGDFSDSKHVVMINVENGSAVNALQALKSKLQQRRSAYLDPSRDPLLTLMETLGKDRQDAVEELKKKSSKIQAELDDQIALAQEACHAESSILAELSQTLQHLQASRDKLLQDMDEIDQRQLDLQHQIALHQQETTEEMEVIDSVEEERKREVPRLKHSISLYASTTGIKWDFLQDDVLSGSVVSFRIKTFFVCLWTACTHATCVSFRSVPCRLFQIVKVSCSFLLTLVTITPSRSLTACGV